MNAIYIQIQASKKTTKGTAEGRSAKDLFKKALVGILTRFIPAANPDFDNKIDEVRIWLLECDTETGIPQREIGLDEQGRVILKMPFKDNHGYWTDNNLLLDDLKKHFIFSEVSKESFEKNWQLFEPGTEL